jgi:N-acetylglucosaminyl-diphospho-decaprenol L-rhamnosyltransferase
MNRKIDIIVVNWNAGMLTLQAVAPYLDFKSNQISCNVIVVDNASSDNSLVLLKDKVPNLISNTKNLGFGKACNQAFAQSEGDYILLLNSDTESSPAILEELVIFLETHTGYAITGPQQKDQNGNILRTCARFPTFATSLYDVLGLSKIFPHIFTPSPVMIDWDHHESKEVDQVMGSYMLIRRPVLDITGFMDDDYFVYTEDRDLSKRIYNAGFKSYYNASCSIIHERGSNGSNVSSQRLFYSMAGRSTYWKKHLGPLSSGTLVFLTITIEPFLRILNSIFQKKGNEVKEISRAYRLYVKKLIHGY